MTSFAHNSRLFLSIITFAILLPTRAYTEIKTNSDVDNVMVVAPIYMEPDATKTRFASLINESLLIHQTAYQLLKTGVGSDSCTPVRKIPVLFTPVSGEISLKFGFSYSHVYLVVGILDSQPSLKKLPTGYALMAVNGVNPMNDAEFNPMMTLLQTGPSTVKLSFEAPLAKEKLDLNVELLTLPCDFKFVLDPAPAEPDAYADGENNILLTSSMVRFVKNKDQLAFVLGHEMSHIQRHHLRDKKVRNVFQQIVTNSAAAFAAQKLQGSESKGYDPEGNLPAAAGVLAGGLGTSPFSKEDEREADRLSLQFLKAAGFDPVKGTAFLKEMAVSLVGTEAFNFTHPASSARYRELMELQGLQPEPIEIPKDDNAGFEPDPQKRVAAQKRNDFLAEQKKKWATKPGIIYFDKDFIEISADEYKKQLQRFNDWKLLQRSLMPRDVRELLGEPKSIVPGRLPAKNAWIYPDGTLDFNDMDLLVGWEAPAAPRKIKNPAGSEEGEETPKLGPKFPEPIDPFHMFPEDMADDTVVGTAELKNGQVIPVTKKQYEDHMRKIKEAAQKAQKEKAAKREFIAKNTRVEYVVGEGKSGDVRNWQHLQKGMSGSEAEDLLGKPLSEEESSDGIFTYKVWSYAKGKIFFYKKKVSRWEAPSAKRVALK